MSRFNVFGCLAAIVIVWHLWPLMAVWIPASSDRAVSAISPDFDWALLGVSILVAAAAAILAVLAGAALALLLILTDLPGRTLLGAVAMLPLLVPPMVWTLAQSYCFGASGLVERLCGDALRPLAAQLNTGQYLSTILVLAEVHAPLAMLLVARGVSRLTALGLDAARLSLSRGELLAWTASALKLEAMTACLVVFALSLGNFAVPHVLQCRLTIVDVYVQSSSYLDQRGALWTSLPLTLVAALALACWLWLSQERADAPLMLAPPVVCRLGRWRWPAFLVVIGLVSVVCLLPLGALLAACGSVAHVAAAVREAWPEVENTLLIAGGAAMIACASAACVSHWLRSKRSWVALSLAALPLFAPPLVLGLAWLRVTQRVAVVDLAWLGDSFWLVVLALASRTWPLGLLVFCIGQRRRPPAETEAARLSGMGMLGRFRWIELPRLREYAAAALVACFVLAAGDVEISQLLCPAGGGTLALRLFTFLHFGPAHVAASLALVQLTVCLLPVVVYVLWSEHWRELV
jgi:iron(III) transport system permease protein